ncbi:MAG: hypothetical protein KC416_17645 [Myxococcales bacterium]|nr:hypothetical protein [Myxococcales bacterium]
MRILQGIPQISTMDVAPELLQCEDGALGAPQRTFLANYQYPHGAPRAGV